MRSTRMAKIEILGQQYEIPEASAELRTIRAELEQAGKHATQSVAQHRVQRARLEKRPPLLGIFPRAPVRILYWEDVEWPVDDEQRFRALERVSASYDQLIDHLKRAEGQYRQFFSPVAQFGQPALAGFLSGCRP